MNTENLQKLSDALGVNQGFSLTSWIEDVDEFVGVVHGNQNASKVACIGGTAELMFDYPWMCGQDHEPLGLTAEVAQDLFLPWTGVNADHDTVTIEMAQKAIAFVISHGKPKWRKMIKYTG